VSCIPETTTTTTVRENIPKTFFGGANF